MGRALVIAEFGSTWGCDIHTLKRLAKGARECGADVGKLQWTSDPWKMARRRNAGEDAARMYNHYLRYPLSLLEDAKKVIEDAGLEFMVTVYIPDDIAAIAPMVRRFKIAAAESQDALFIMDHLKGPSLKGGVWNGHEVIISLNPGKEVPMHLDAPQCVKTLHCISLYPAPIETLKLGVHMPYVDGFSDHTTSLVTGAAAVAMGGTIIEKHVRLYDTSEKNPDYGHSLIVDDRAACNLCEGEQTCGNEAGYFGHYVDNIREAEKAI